MDFKTIPLTAQPAYTWLWNSTITREGIHQQIDEMHQAGIRAFYALGEPENFRPQRRRTHLAPEYLSNEYIDLVYEAYAYAKKKGMHMWLYNEGGFPSGMVCGKIREQHPELARKEFAVVPFLLEKGCPYQPHAQALSAFVGEERILPGTCPAQDVTVTEYRYQDDMGTPIQTDNASRRNVELFLEMTHERLKARFGEAMGDDIKLMFDDEAYMGPWTDGLDRLFLETYGYDMTDYMPYIAGQIAPKTEAQCRARSDYAMLCGELVRRNYFTPMKEWLRATNMCSAGHLDSDHRSDSCLINRYGSTLATLREFDVPGVDVIWSQINYPQEGKSCTEGMAFFPRMASSAARQLGHSLCLSESLAVYGAHVTPEQMRYVVNYQAVRGISLFNFMVISYDRETAMALQYRPNFIPENPGMERLAGMNTYTARLSHLLQSSHADIRVALYHPARSICAGGQPGNEAIASFEALGHALEDAGVAFDLIDEALVSTATVKDGKLICEHVTYDNVLVPTGALENPALMAKLAATGKEMPACIGRKSRYLQARHLLLGDGSEGYFICNTGNETVSETVTLPSTLPLYRLELADGELYTMPCTVENSSTVLPISLLRGEGIFLLLSSKPQAAKQPACYEPLCALTDISSFTSRTYTLEPGRGMVNTYCKTGNERHGLYEWEKSFSGEVTYTIPLPTVATGEYLLDLGEVRYTATVYLDGEQVGEVSMPPYRLPLSLREGSHMLTVAVANTAANACAHTDYFEKTHPWDVGPYHANMVEHEACEPGGGLLGPVSLLRRV